MENKINYTILGVFVMGLFVAIVGAILWMSDYSANKQFKYYQVTTKEAVSGLNVQAAVKYKGVSVGQVTNISINPNNSEEVLIKIRVTPNTPIKKDSYAVIEPQGITGLSYMELKGGTKNSPLLKTSASSPATIITKPSLFSRVDTSFSVISEKTESLLVTTDNMMRKIDSILSDKNTKNIEKILENTAKLSESMASLSDSLNRQRKNISDILKEARDVEKTMAESIKSFGDMSTQITSIVSSSGVEALQKMSQSADSMRELMNNMENKVNSGMFDVQTSLDQVVQPTSEMMNQLNLFIIQAGQLIEQLKQSPSDILYKSSSPNPGPGESDIKEKK